MLVDRDHPEVCPALAIASMILRKVRLRHSTKLSLAIFKAKDGTVQYLTHSKVTDMIRKAVKTVYPNISKKDLMMYSCHSIRVWTCVCLDEAGMPPDFIKKRLRWLGESYRVYLRDTNNINELHNAALKESAKTAVELIRFIHSTDSDQLLDEDIPEMGEYDQGD